MLSTKIAQRCLFLFLASSSGQVQKDLFLLVGKKVIGHLSERKHSWASLRFTSNHSLNHWLAAGMGDSLSNSFLGVGNQRQQGRTASNSGSGPHHFLHCLQDPCGIKWVRHFQFMRYRAWVFWEAGGLSGYKQWLIISALFSKKESSHLKILLILLFKRNVTNLV